MRLHNRGRTVQIRLFLIFVSTFVIAFLVLNSRFVEANIRFVLFPKTITRPSSIGTVALLPIAKDVKEQPLPDSARLVIDEIGVDAPIVFGVPDNNDLIYKNLEKGVVHYSTTSKPGTGGVAIILGHSSAYPWYKGNYGAVFALLNKLKPGDRFYVQYDDDRAFFYEMSQSIVFNPFSSDERVAALEQTSEDTVILISCFPVGTNYRRIAVQARRIDI